MRALPPGFVLEDDAGQPSSSLPPGFVLETGSPAPPASFGEFGQTGARATQQRFGNYGVMEEMSPEGQLGQALTRRADERLVGPDSLSNRISAALLNAGDMLTMGLARNAGAGVASLLNGRSFRENFQLATEQHDALSRLAPAAADLGTAAGIVGGFGLPVARVFNNGAMAGRVGNTALTTSGYSGLASAAGEGLDRTAEPTTIAKALVHAGVGAGTGAFVHGFLEKGVPSLARAFTGATDEVAGAAPTAFPKGVTPAIAREAEAGQFGISLTRGQATGEYGQQAREAMLARSPEDSPAGQAMRSFYRDQEGQVAAAKADIGRGLGGGLDRVERPYDAGVSVAEFAQNSQRLAEAVAAREEALAARARDALGPADPVNAAADVAAGVRTRAAADKARYGEAYADVAAMPGRFEPGVFDKVGGEVRNAMGAAAVFVDPVLTPAAHRALRMLDDMPTLRLAGVGPQPARLLGPAPRGSGLTPSAPPMAASSGGQAAARPKVGDAILTPSGQRIGVDYRVVDASELRTSHRSDFSPDPAYPAALQPRDRGRAAAERQVQEIASDLKPEWLGASPSAREGAPVVGPDGVVESGNGRIMGIRRAYAEDGDSARRYRDWLASQGYETVGLKEPVLIRARTSDLSPQERIAFAQEANASAGLSMGAAEKAASDAQRLPAGALDLYQGGDVADVANREFVRAFIRSIPKGEEGALVTKAGDLSLEGAQRLRNALLHQAYGDSHLVSSLAEIGDDTIKSFGRVLQDVAPDVARLRVGIAGGQVASVADLSKPLLEAAQLVQAARQRGLKLSEAVAQQDAFRPLAPETDAVLRLVYGPDLAGRVNRERAGEALRAALADAGKQTNEAGLFGQGPLSAADILSAKAARGSTADAAPRSGSGMPGDPIRMTAEEFRAMQAAGPAPAPPAAEMTSGALDMRGVDQARKRLVAAYSAAKASGNATDKRAVSEIIKAFDDRVESAMADGLFSGSDEALTRLREARALFRDYQRTYRPQGAGDDVGRAMQQIVDRDAQPQEVANLLWGTSLTGNTSRAMRLADRLREVLPPELWGQVQRGYIGRIVGDGQDGAKIVANIQKALTGEGRGLTYRLLTDREVSALRSIQSGLRTASTVREAVPEWVQKLAARDFEPAEVVRNLFGKSTVTGNTASLQYAKGIRDLVGPESETWAAVRQAGWQHLVSKPEGATADWGPQAVANRIANFLEKEGRGLAHVLYTAEERATIKAFGNVMRTLTPARIAGGSASPNSDTAPMLQRALETLSRHEGKLNAMLSMVGFVKGGVPGAAAAFGVGKVANRVAAGMAERQAAASAREAVAGAPTVETIFPPAGKVPSIPAFQGPLAELLRLTAEQR